MAAVPFNPDPLAQVDPKKIGPLRDGVMGDHSVSLDGLDQLMAEGQNPSSEDLAVRQLGVQPQPPATGFEQLTGATPSGQVTSMGSAGMGNEPGTSATTGIGQGQGHGSAAGGDSVTGHSMYGLGDDSGSVLSGGSLSDPADRSAIAALYGDDFPLLKDHPTEVDWVSWAQHAWTNYGAGTYAIIHMVERNRLFRKGQQWISSVGFGPWREPMKPRDAARIVDNMISPALDQRIQLIMEQRPGFNCEPESQDHDKVKRAEAAQAALEYSWKEQKMPLIVQEGAYWTGTDGVCFLELYWDPDAGPWVDPKTYVDPESGKALLPWTRQFPAGDVRTRVRRIEQVRVSPEATATRRPWLWLIREVISKNEAVRTYGKDVADEVGTFNYDDNLQHIPISRMGFIYPEIDELTRTQQTVSRVTVYAEKSEYIPTGFQMTLVANKLVVPPMPLLIGEVPIVRWTDGSTDPSFFPIAEMNKWVDSQIRQNTLWSKWVEGIRKHSGINVLAREGTISTESFSAGSMNIWGVKGTMPLQDVLKEVGGHPISPDVVQALQANQKRFEDLTGWNDTSRGSMTAGDSGRAILAIREQLERVFAPMIQAASISFTDWAKLVLKFMRWGYDIPRQIALEGRSRPDLGMVLSNQDLDQTSHVWIEPETLMPMPRSLRLSMLDDMFQKQLVSPQEYRSRMPFAWVRNMDSPDVHHKARAERIAQMIIQTGNPMPEPILWMDDEHTHQTVLEEEILLQPDQPQMVLAAAYERWILLAQQGAAKQQAMAMGMMGPMPGTPPPMWPPDGSQGEVPAPNQQQQPLQGPGQQLGAQQAPLALNNPPVAAAPMQQIGLTSGDQNTRLFEQGQPIK